MNEFEAVAAFAVAAVVTLVTTPLTGATLGARRRDRHAARPRPSRGTRARLGGLAILAGVLVAAVLFLPIDAQTRGILGGALLVTLVGALDDLYDLPPRVKLAGQIAAAAIPVAAGVRVESFTLPFVGRGGPRVPRAEAF